MPAEDDPQVTIDVIARPDARPDTVTQPSGSGGGSPYQPISQPWTPTYDPPMRDGGSRLPQPPADSDTGMMADVVEAAQSVETPEDLQTMLDTLRDEGARLRDVRIKLDADGSLDSFEFVADMPGRNDDFIFAYDMDTDQFIALEYDGNLWTGRSMLRDFGLRGDLGDSVRRAEEGGSGGTAPLPPGPEREPPVTVPPSPEPWTPPVNPCPGPRGVNGEVYPEGHFWENGYCTYGSGGELIA